jgi:hypothetical protein
MKQHKVKKVSFADNEKEFTRYMRTYCEMQLGWKHPLSQQSPLWWTAQYEALNNIPEQELFKVTPIFRIQKIGSQWYDTQEWTGEFHGVMGRVIINA